MSATPPAQPGNTAPDYRVLLLWAVVGLAAGAGSMTFLPFFMIGGAVAILWVGLRLLAPGTVKLGMGTALIAAAIPVGRWALRSPVIPTGVALASVLLVAGLFLANVWRRERRQTTPTA